MAEPYFAQLTEMLEGIQISEVALECKHFFSGAALYADGKICASLGPVGFAVKLPEEKRLDLIREEKGSEFRYFASGPVKRDYVLLKESVIQDDQAFQEIFSQSVEFVLGPTV